MSAITLDFSDDRVDRLKERAALLGISVEDLVRLSIDEMLNQPDEQFQQAADYVLKKNAELYRRLA